MLKSDLLIIGGGPAAITVAKNVKGTREVTVIRPEDYSMIYCAMPYAVEGLLNMEKTFKSDQLLHEVDAKLIRGTVTSVDFDKKSVIVDNKDEIHYNDLIIATGAQPIVPPIKGIHFDNIMSFKTENDLREVMNIVDSGLKDAVVIGAGAIGIELAQALNKRNVNTYLIDMFPNILPNMLDEDMIKNVQDELSNTNLNLVLDNKVLAFDGDDFAHEVILEQGDSIKFETKPLIIFAVGMRANVQLFKGTTLEIGKTGIIVNDKMETNIENVYAIGDVCEFTNAITGKIALGKLATNAVPMGKVLAKNLIGEDRKYTGFYNGAATKVEDFFVGSTGLTEKEAIIQGYDVVSSRVKFTTTFPIMPFAKTVEIKLVANRTSRKVLGAQFVSGQPVTDKVDLITMAIQFGITVDQLVSFSYSSQPYQSYYPANNLITQAAELILQKINHTNTDSKLLHV